MLTRRELSLGAGAFALAACTQTQNKADASEMKMSETNTTNWANLSEREWKHRLRGYGYAIKDTDEGRFVTSVIQGAALCSLPVHAAT